MNKQEVMATMMKCGEELGHAPSQTELMRMSKVNRRQIRKYFGSYLLALRECNMERKGGGHKVEMEALFRDWAGIVRKLKKLPSLSEYELRSEYSHSPLTTRYGGWMNVPRGMKAYVEQQGWTEEWADVVSMIGTQEQQEAEQQARCMGTTTRPSKGARVLMNQPIYGPMIRPYPLVLAPMNEDGVIFLFGALAEKLGYAVTLIQGAFPDCEAYRQIEGGFLQRVRIEFEHKSRNFLIHGHDVNGCDAIVCWEHNWPECPLEVIELKEVVRERKDCQNCQDCQNRRN